MTIITPDSRAALIREPRLFIPNKMPLGPVVYQPEHFLSQDLLAHWLLRERLRYSRDMTPNGFDGVYSGTPTVVLDSEKGWVLETNSADYVDTGEEIITGGEFTVAFFMKNGSQQNGLACPISQGHLANNGFAFQWGSHGATYLSIDGIGASTFVFQAYTETDYLWHHVAVTHDVHNKNRVYFDGVQTELKSVVAGPSYGSGVMSFTSEFTLYSNYDFQLGRDDRLGRYWDGRLQDVRVYSRALSAGEMFALGTDAFQNLMPA